MTMGVFLHSSGESRVCDYGISSREEVVCPSSPEQERVMTMVILNLSSGESCGGDHGISSLEAGVWTSSPKKEKSMTMVIFFPFSVESCGGGLCHQLLQKRMSALLVLRRRR